VLHAWSSAACAHAMFGSALQHQLGPNEPARSRLADLCRKQASANAKANAARPADSGSVRGRSSQWCTVDLSNSDAWLRLHVAKAPTVTASHNTRSIFVTHPVDRFLLPQVPLQPSVPQSTASCCGTTARRTECRIARTHARTHARTLAIVRAASCAAVVTAGAHAAPGLLLGASAGRERGVQGRAACDGADRWQCDSDGDKHGECCTVDTSLMEYCGSTLQWPDRGSHCTSSCACVAVGFVRDQRCTRNWSQLALPMHEYPRVPHNHTEYTAQVLLRALALCFGEIFVMGAPPAAEVKLKPMITAAAAARRRKRKRLVRLHTVTCTISKMPSAQRSLSRALPSA